MVAYNHLMWWYISRASGLVLLVVVAASILWGLAVSGRMVRRKGMPAWMLDLHTHLGTLALAMTAVHLLSLWADSFTHFGPKELFIPFAYKTPKGAVATRAGVAIGISAMYLLVIVQITSWVRKHMPRKLWHAFHLLSLPLFVLGAIHGVVAGTDWSNRLVRWSLLLIAPILVGAATVRVLAPKPGATNDRLAAARAAQAKAATARATSARVAAARDDDEDDDKESTLAG